MARAKAEPHLMDRGLPDEDLLKLALAVCNEARNVGIDVNLSSGEYLSTDSYAVAAAIGVRLNGKRA